MWYKFVTLWDFDKTVHSLFSLLWFPPILGAISIEVWWCWMAVYLPLCCTSLFSLQESIYVLYNVAIKNNKDKKKPKMASSLLLSKEMNMIKVSGETHFPRNKKLKCAFQAYLKRKNKIVIKYAEWFNLYLFISFGFGWGNNFPINFQTCMYFRDFLKIMFLMNSHLSYNSVWQEWVTYKMIPKSFNIYIYTYINKLAEVSFSLEQ